MYFFYHFESYFSNPDKAQKSMSDIILFDLAPNYFRDAASRERYRFARRILFNLHSHQISANHLLSKFFKSILS